jgi:hypothetical protein
MARWHAEKRPKSGALGRAGVVCLDALGCACKVGGMQHGFVGPQRGRPRSGDGQGPSPANDDGQPAVAEAGWQQKTSRLGLLRLSGRGLLQTLQPSRGCTSNGGAATEIAALSAAASCFQPRIPAQA